LTLWLDVLDGIDLIWADAGRGANIGIVTARRQRVCVSSATGSSLTLWPWKCRWPADNIVGVLYHKL